MANRVWAICLELMLEVTAILTTLEPGALWSDLAKYRAGLRERERVEPGPGPHMSPVCDQKLALSSFRVQTFFSSWHRLLVLIELFIIIYPFDLEITCQAEPADLEDQGKHWEGIDYQISEAATDRSSQSGPDEVTGAD